MQKNGVSGSNTVTGFLEAAIEAAKTERLENGVSGSNTVARFLEAAIQLAKTELPGAVPDLKVSLAKIAGLPPLPPTPAHHDAATLEMVAQRARAAAWPGDRSLRAPEFIQAHFSEWLAEPDASGNWSARTLWREDLAKIDPKLMSAYSTAVSRDKSQAVPGLYVRPAKKHPAHSQASIRRVVAEMQPEEVEARRARGRAAQRAYAERQRKNQL